MKEDVLAPPPESDDVINDFDIEEEVIEVENRWVVPPDHLRVLICHSATVCSCINAWTFPHREENLAKIARRVKDYKVEELNPPREGKRLLVLDVDYTLFGETGRVESVITPF